jgi:gluconate 5-dehydrogenase
MTVPALFDMSGKVALVTGGSRGLGFAAASALGGAGATVVITGRSEDTLAHSAATLAAAGVRCATLAFDVVDPVAGRQAVERVVAEHGRLDVLVANAGLVNRAPIGEWTTDHWDVVLDTNLRSALFLAQAAAEPMKRQGAGKLIFTSSITGMMGRATIHAYVASKSGLAGLARSLAAELGPFGITCNSIAPGYFETDLNKALLADPAFVERVVGRTALKRWGRPEEFGGVALMLASRAGDYITGQQIVVDGGVTATM